MFQSEDTAAAHIENFGLRIFAKADNEDRAGNATKSAHLVIDYVTLSD